jgi:hypothetical protein
MEVTLEGSDSAETFPLWGGGIRKHRRLHGRVEPWTVDSFAVMVEGEIVCNRARPVASAESEKAVLVPGSNPGVARSFR